MATNEATFQQYSLLPIFKDDDHSITESFHEYSKLNRENAAGLAKRVGMILHDPKIKAMMARSWKTYNGSERIALPPARLGSVSLEDSLRNRNSISSTRAGVFSGETIQLEQLAAVLGLSYGITRSRIIPGTSQEQHLRATASAGALYPLEIYPVVFSVDGLDEGIYHYSVVDHALEVVRKGPCKAEFLKTTSFVDMCSTAAVVLVVSAMFQRNLSKYLNRGYRFIMNDTGALLQSFYLTGVAAGLGTCALGGFYDDELGTLLGINNVDEAPVIGFLLGRTL
jgi:SagB-type dehydrogenase family enzyme